MDESPRRRFSISLVEWGIVLAILVVIAAIAVPGVLSSRRASNERHASTSLKTLSTAEADFRANDRDENKVNDFWTADVAGLYTLKSPSTQQELRLIDESVARADPQPLLRMGGGLSPDQGYVFQALLRDDNDPPTEFYRTDTDRSGRKVHHLNKFGFSAYPATSTSGKFSFIVNENNTIFRFEGGEPRGSWPSDTWFQQQPGWNGK